MGETKHTSMAIEQVPLPLETVFAKEDKKRSCSVVEIT